jgi:hypothetical protein
MQPPRDARRSTAHPARDVHHQRSIFTQLHPRGCQLLYQLVRRRTIPAAWVRVSTDRLPRLVDTAGRTHTLKREGKGVNSDSLDAIRWEMSSHRRFTTPTQSLNTPVPRASRTPRKCCGRCPFSVAPCQTLLDRFAVTHQCRFRTRGRGPRRSRRPRNARWDPPPLPPCPPSPRRCSCRHAPPPER